MPRHRGRLVKRALEPAAVAVAADTATSAMLLNARAKFDEYDKVWLATM